MVKRRKGKGGGSMEKRSVWNKRQHYDSAHDGGENGVGVSFLLQERRVATSSPS